MKIIYIYHTIALTGGLERILVNKMNYLADKLHHEVYLLTSSQGNHPLSFLLSPNIRHIDLNIRLHIQYQYAMPKRLWLKFKLQHLCNRRLKATIEKIDPDIIVCPTTYLAAEVCKLKCRAKKVVESHLAKNYTWVTDNFTLGFLKDLKNKFNISRRFRIIEKYSDAIITLTQADAKAWKKSSKVYVIPNFTTLITPQSSTCEALRVMAAGRLTYQKGFDRLIDAWKIINNEHPDWKLDIFGEGIHKELLEKQIKRYQLENVITIRPFTKNISQEYLKSSIFALSSNYEGFGLVLIEAMGCGVPCVSFDCPQGPSEIIKDKEDGFLIKDGDITGFARAICYLIENERERKLFGKRAKENVKRYLPEIIMPQWENLFNKLLKR